MQNLMQIQTTRGVRTIQPSPTSECIESNFTCAKQIIHDKPRFGHPLWRLYAQVQYTYMMYDIHYNQNMWVGKKPALKISRTKWWGNKNIIFEKNMRKIWHTWKILTWRAAMAVSFFSSLSSNSRQACHRVTVQPESWTWRYLWRFRC